MDISTAPKTIAGESIPLIALYSIRLNNFLFYIDTIFNNKLFRYSFWFNPMIS